jgi:glyoxylase-like metal-dependent hydrolase (beta-lactamase superfamily II)
MRPAEVAPGVYAVTTPARDFPSPENKGWNSNSAFVVTGSGVLVVDTGSSETIGQALRRAIASVTDQPVRWIVNTHGHGDHWLGNAGLTDGGVEVIASTQVAARIRAEREQWVGLFERMTDGATGDSPAVAPTRVVDERTVMRLGGVAFELLPSGGSHTPGDLVVWLPEKKVLITGDVVYSDRAPTTREGDVQRWIAFLGELEALAPQVVVPGHGAVTGVEGISNLRRYFETLWALVRAGYEQGQSDFEILPQVRAQMADMGRQYPGFEDKIGRSVSDVYLQVEQSAF